MKGIILAGGKGTRLYPATLAVCKQLLPVYNKPMIYYPLSVLMLAGIREILIISTAEATPQFEKLFGDGGHLGLKISYAIQERPGGIAESILIAEEFIGKDKFCLILGDNIFYGDKMSQLFQNLKLSRGSATVFGYYVNHPERYGVLSLDKNKKATAITEKPHKPASNWAVTGLYFYDYRAVEFTKKLKPSQRGELEITDLNREYLKRRQLNVVLLGRGYAWLDTGSYSSLIDASVFIKTIEERQGLIIGCIEEIAYHYGYINKSQLLKLAKQIPTEYGDYLVRLTKAK